MLDWLISKGFTVTLKEGWVMLTKGGDVGNYSTVRAAFEANGGPMWATFVPGKPRAEGARP